MPAAPPGHPAPLRDWLPSATTYAPRHAQPLEPSARRTARARRGPGDSPVPVPRAPTHDDLPPAPANPPWTGHGPAVRHFDPTGFAPGRWSRVPVPVELCPPSRTPPAPHVAPPQPEPAVEGSGRRRLIAGAALNVLALLGAGMTGVTVWAADHGMHPMVVRSGSMEPLIRTGSMVIVRTVPASQVQVGDVVAVKRPDGVVQTHRVVALERDGRRATLTTKGDANDAKDPAPVVVAEAGELVLSVPTVGRVAAFAATTEGGIVIGGVVSGVLVSLKKARRR